jgi:hypothetical protein
MTKINRIYETADRLAALYEEAFGGKSNGRYRLASKLMRTLLDRKRIYLDELETLRRALLERGYILIDMDSFYAVLSANAFVNYRRANEDCLPTDLTDQRD